MEGNVLATAPAGKSPVILFKLLSGCCNYSACKISVQPNSATLHLGFPDGTVVKNLPADPGDVGSISRLARSPREGNDNPLQYSCLRNPIERGAWRATVHGAAKSHTTERTHTSLLFPGLLEFIERRRLALTPSVIPLASYHVIGHLLVSVTTSPRWPDWLLHPGIMCLPHHSSFLKVYLHISCPLLEAPSTEHKYNQTPPSSPIASLEQFSQGYLRCCLPGLES